MSKRLVKEWSGNILLHHGDYLYEYIPADRMMGNSMLAATDNDALEAIQRDGIAPKKTEEE